jgi:hypothetical protein
MTNSCGTMASTLLHQSSAIPSKALHETTETVEVQLYNEFLESDMINMCAWANGGALGYSRL